MPQAWEDASASHDAACLVSLLVTLRSSHTSCHNQPFVCPPLTLGFCILFISSGSDIIMLIKSADPASGDPANGLGTSAPVPTPGELAGVPGGGGVAAGELGGGGAAGDGPGDAAVLPPALAPSEETGEEALLECSRGGGEALATSGDAPSAIVGPLAPASGVEGVEGVEGVGALPPGCWAAADSTALTSWMTCVGVGSMQSSHNSSLAGFPQSTPQGVPHLPFTHQHSEVGGTSACGVHVYDCCSTHACTVLPTTPVASVHTHLHRLLVILILGSILRVGIDVHEDAHDAWLLQLRKQHRLTHQLAANG